MNYISAEQFLKLPEKVQEVFKDWAENTLGEWDLVYDTESKVAKHIEQVLDTTKDNINVGRVFYLDRNICWTSIHDSLIVPLFRLGQLWDFIESNGYQIGVNNFIDKSQWNVKVFKSMMQFKPDIEAQYEDKLKAFWEMAVLVAKEKARGKDEESES